MTALLSTTDSLLFGSQTPRVEVLPAGAVGTAAQECIDLAASVGLLLDPWQRRCLEVILAEDAQGKTAAMTAGLVVPRQNGKGSILEALELAWLFLWEVPLVMHSAHLFKTSQEAFKRLLIHVNTTPWLSDEVKRISVAHGKEGIETKSGSRIDFVARSKGSGRGFTADRLVLDEAYDLPDLELDAAMPTLSARPDIQIVMTSSAPMVDSTTLRRVRRRALEGDTHRFAYLEWSVDPTDFDPDSESDWAKANPGYGFRISRDAVVNERATMSESGFSRERLGVPDEQSAGAAFDVVAFEAALSDDAAPASNLWLGIDAAPDGGAGAIVASDGLCVEVVDYRPALHWLPDRIVELSERHRAEVVLDPSGPAGALVPQLSTRLGTSLHLASIRDMTHACGMFDEKLRSGGISVRRNADLRQAVSSSRRRKVGDAWALRRGDGSDICPAVAAVLAVWGAAHASSDYDVRDSILGGRA